MAETLNAENFTAFIKSRNLPVVVDFFRDGCIPCRRIAPLLSRSEVALEGKLLFARVNIGLNPALMEQYNVEAAPTLIAFQNGAEIARHRGAATADELSEFLLSIIKERA